MSTTTLAPASSHSNFPVTLAAQSTDEVERSVSSLATILHCDLFDVRGLPKGNYESRVAALEAGLRRLVCCAVLPKVDGHVFYECDIIDKLALTVKFKGDHRNLELTREQVVLDLTATKLTADQLEEIRFCPEFNGATIVCRPFPETILGRLIVTYECECQL